MRHIFTPYFLLILLTMLCTACGTALPTVKPYKLEVQQGNVVTSKMLLQLRPGMTKSQVRFIMGTPLIQDSFHGNRWDYVYQMREGGKVIEQRRVILDFEKDLLKTVRGDVIPTGSGTDKTAEDVNVNTGPRVLKSDTKPKEKSLLDKLKFWEKDNASHEKDKVKAVAKEAPVEKPTVTIETKSEPAPVASEDEKKSMLSVPLEVAPVVDTAPAIPEKAPVAEPPIKKESAVKVEPAPQAKTPAKEAVETKEKALPEEGTPGFFEQMLEKIGF